MFDKTADADNDSASNGKQQSCAKDGLSKKYEEYVHAIHHTCPRTVCAHNAGSSANIADAPFGIAAAAAFREVPKGFGISPVISSAKRAGTLAPIIDSTC